MSSIYGLGQSTTSVQFTRETKKTDESGKTEQAGRRPPPPPPQYDSCTLSEEALATMSNTAEETMFDYMDETDTIDYESLGLTEEDFDFSEYEVFDGIDYVSDEDISTEGDVSVESDEEILLEDVADEVELEEELDGDEEVDTDSDSTSTTIDTTSRVHGYVSSISEEDRLKMQVAFEASQLLTWEGSSLFDYIGDTSSWFESSASLYDTSSYDSSSYDWDSLLSAFSSLTTTDTSTDTTTDTSTEVDGTDSSDVTSEEETEVNTED